ncbi:hypothetical protein Aab01nite_57100 [Paractinoplanes abujensis]|uniref:Cation transport regulator ChaB n=1 Tax=Paractinoplanes abujensis TaxID=882441 RepID=A0A7W7G3A8_9ACTN|nr:hypothetical protein [Actinoplanes abujensis]MBB4696128.1 cation transport regulator ChaB [Actinoplanes abujensis]GID22120.1 hypothetical protein Aab01nite_57100 [Actinoplanes abujensis]
MTDLKFGYDVLLTDDGTPTNIIASQETPGSPFRAVLWSVPDRRWIYAPAIAADILYDDDDARRTEAIDRTTAERIAAENLRSELPSEETLLVLFAEGERMGWRFGPPQR